MYLIEGFITISYLWNLAQIVAHNCAVSLWDKHHYVAWRSRYMCYTTWDHLYTIIYNVVLVSMLVCQIMCPNNLNNRLNSERNRFIPMIIRCLGIPALTSSWMMDPMVLHMASMDSRCSGQSCEILDRSNHTVDGAPRMGVYGLMAWRQGSEVSFITGNLNIVNPLRVSDILSSWTVLFLLLWPYLVIQSLQRGEECSLYE